ncbi:PAS domain-containing sensor histidine kinase [Anabaena cylindrica FACHB-243]|uniref:histidine kinase n=1 Tax=Anabaena cylindrica (strain ATCC 27899 / PCC 7122) TaxID=272123 RepID=K9ZHR3_ANACC|nr:MULTISPECIES: PAS domain-containing protein [Anabaena]AFZ57890.1 PAS/PAC sensor signal transduction histidine kinase [Anabaena cylindrica PCC 7122]MBD2419754.1 PAS domain-containing sensor histidine kinase [Anabaena cylindrica FACHB-243]MBY5281541.1 PAS domain-containing sensor histidine kinase [Anabaena sp. CCAP 1446/1C]MBY5307205.1 PAS domain-containing sensor histidine kinase [Anabaena sp. CCAP 1446/1C]MCM2405568.1 PAS domain-containing protein [Anabaena sp. CCAP 1446/1C]
MTQFSETPEMPTNEVNALKQEISTLQQRVAQLEQELAHLRNSESNHSPASQYQDTDRKSDQLVETELPEKTNLLELILNSMSDAVVVTDINGKFLFNSAAVQMYGSGSTDIQPEEWSQHYGLFLPDQITPLPAAEIPLVRSLKGETFENVELFSRHQQAPEGIWTNISGRPIKDDNGEIKGGVVVCRNVTERKQVEEKLRQREDFLQTIYATVELGIFVVDVTETDEFRLVGFNPLIEQMIGLTTEQIQGKTLVEAFGEVVSVSFEQNYRRCIKAGTSISYEESVHFGQETQWFFTTLSPLKNTQGKIYRIIGTNLEITDRKHAEKELLETKNLYQQILDSMPDFVLCKGAESRIVYANKAFRDYYGMTLEQLQTIIDAPFNNPDYTQQYIQDDAYVFNTGKTLIIEEKITRYDGVVHTFSTIKNAIFDTEGSVTQTVGISRDITDRKQADAALKQKTNQLEQALIELQQTQLQMIQSEKMSSLGQMVAGVAHEINNPVNFIHGNLSHIEEYTQDLLRLLNLYQQNYPEPSLEIQEEIAAIDLEFLTEDIKKVLQSMLIGTKRIREIVLSLRNFSRLDESEVKNVNLHEGIDSTITILHNRMKATPERAKIQLIKNYGDLPLVECYAGQLNQVFMNIISNAIDAIEQKNINCHNQQVVNEPNCITISTKLINQNIIKIIIADNGMGIPKSLKHRIFDPFYTTKSVGKGTGLGLSISYQIITEKHNGLLECFSAEGKGTQFIIQIPTKIR